MQKTWKVLMVAAMVLLAAGMVFAGGDQEEEAAAGTAEAESQYPFGPPPWTIGMSQDTMDHPWRAYMVTSAETESKNYPDLIKEFIYTDAKGTNEKQIADVEDLIARGVDLIIMSPREAQGLVPAVD